MLESWFNTASTTVTAVERSADAQAQVDAATSHMALYHYESCMFCARVRRAIGTLKLNIELRDVLRDPTHRNDLVAGGGSTTVPCLRIEEGGKTNWMYESADIIAYLNRRFGAGTTQA